MPSTHDSESPISPQDPTDAALSRPRALRPEEQDPKLWVGDGWTARITKNDDDGWAVEMTADGENEPALVGPWTMGRDKRNPKPIDVGAFAVLVKTANEVRARHLQQLHAQLHRRVSTTAPDGARLRVDLDIVPDPDDPHAILTAVDATGVTSMRARVAANFRLTAESARRWVEGGGRDRAELEP